jgi:phenylalanyl-tRNA synthetase beta chain
MNLSLNWLNDYVNTESIPLADLLSGLTMSGSKVEKYKDLSESLSKIVIGKVVQIQKHENSDKLWICKVDVGDSMVQIVTGAQNVTEGAIVPVVLDGGTVLSRQEGSVTKIKKGKLRGEVSEGMLCSPDELGLSKSDLPYADEDGILILSNDPESDKLTIGACALEFLGLKDTVIEFEITNNRPDCFSVTGLAREVSATFDLPLNIPAPEYKGQECDITKEISVTVENTEMCSRYMAGIAKNVKIAPSPRWLASRLKAQGIRPINNIVDITNYVMLEYGNPLHAFDKRFIEGGEIIVRNASKDEQITLLDGNTVTLDTEVLVIADKAKPIAVAGVMGGEFSGVVEDTVTVVFEAACFDGVGVRRAAKKIGRRTESSARFEKGLDPGNVKTALLRALQLVEELGAGEVADTLIDVANYEQTEGRVHLDYAAVNRFLGTDIDKGEQLAIFDRLGFGWSEIDKQVIVPNHRSDIKLPCDLAEEVARIYGYDKVESTLPRLSGTTQSNEHDGKIRRLVSALTAQGCHECITYSFVSPEMANENAVRIRNPFGEETSVMRTSMIPSMLKVIEKNLRVRNTEGRLFEIGRVYKNDSEPDMLCIALYGKNEDFYTLKGIFEEILNYFKVNISVKRYTDSPFHPGRAAYCDYAKFGEISPLVLREYGISERVYAAEIDVERFFAQCDNKVVYTSIPEYPSVQRDLTLVCDDDVASGLIVELIEKSRGKHLQEVEFFDVFKGGTLSESQKSISYKLTFRKTDGTLTDEEVDKSITQILSKLEENNIKLRT